MGMAANINPVGPQADSNQTARDAAVIVVDPATDNNNNNGSTRYPRKYYWTRAASNYDGLLVVVSIMMGVGSVVPDDATAIIRTGMVLMVAGACGMAAKTFFSVYTENKLKVAEMMMREQRADDRLVSIENQLSSPLHAAAVSAFVYAVSAAVPLVAAAFVGSYYWRLGAVVAAASFTLLVFGGIGGTLGGEPCLIFSLRMLVGGWIAMGIAAGLIKLIASAAAL